MGAGDQQLGEAVDRGPRLAVDVGAVRVGLAASDPDGVLASPVATLDRATSTATVVAETVERRARCVYVGLPRQLSGREGSAAADAREYAGALAQAVAPVTVRLFDERLSTTVAHQALRAAGRPTRDHRRVVDQAAAVVILQDALDVERATGRRAGLQVTVPAPAGGDAGGRGEGTSESGVSG